MRNNRVYEGSAHFKGVPGFTTKMMLTRVCSRTRTHLGTHHFSLESWGPLKSVIPLGNGKITIFLASREGNLDLSVNCCGAYSQSDAIVILLFCIQSSE